MIRKTVWLLCDVAVYVFAVAMVAGVVYGMIQSGCRQ
jgi:hypothetical protein